MRYKLIAPFLTPLLVITGCSGPSIIKEKRFLMDSVVTIEAPSSRGLNIRRAIDDAFLRMEDVIGLASRFDEESECSAINRLKKDEEINLSPELLYLINRSLETSDITEGAFDITVAPLVELWEFYRKKEELVPAGLIETALDSVGSKNIILNNGILRFAKEGVTIDLSGIAAGYAVDEAVKSLKENGVDNGLIDAGGDIYCLGAGPAKAGWRIGVRHPRDKSIIGILTLKDTAVTTSGDYERFFIKDGRRYSHIIDPRSGYPAESFAVSATVTAKDCVTADALATALIVMGAKKGIKLAEELDDVEAIIISETDGGSLVVETTSGIDEIYQPLTYPLPRLVLRSLGEGGRGRGCQVRSAWRG